MVAALEMVGIEKRFGSGEGAVAALRGVSVSVRAGEVVALVGRSGSGKSTLLHIAGGLESADAGEARVCGVELHGRNATERSAVQRAHVGFVFQLFHLLPTLTVAENVELPLVLARRKAEPGQIADLLEALDLAGLGRRQPTELSGGQMQRVAIARALITSPDLLLADEPTGALDAATGRIVLDLLLRTARAKGSAVVIATHDPGVAAAADRTVPLADGRVSPDPVDGSLAMPR